MSATVVPVSSTFLTIQQRTSSRDVPDLQLRRNRRRTSQSSNSVATLRVLQETVETYQDESHGSNLGSRLSPNPANGLAAPWSGADSHKSSSRHLNSSRSGSFTNVSSSPGQGSLRRPSLSMNRSRSRLTIPRHVDRAKSSDDEFRSTSPLISPVSPAMDATFALNYSNRPSGLSTSLRTPSVSSFRRQSSMLPEEKEEATSNGIDIDVAAGNSEVDQTDAENLQTQNGAITQRTADALSQSVPAIHDDLQDFDAKRARSTSISSARTGAFPHHASSQQSSLYPSARTNHRRERSATISSHSLDPLLPPPSTLLSGRPNLSTLVSHPEEEMQGLPTLGDHHALEEVTYVDQRILRNRLVRCFITFANVEHVRRDSQSHPERSWRTDAKRTSVGDEDTTVSRRTPPNSQHAKSSSAELRDIANALTPFYISPIHVKSTHPTFSGLTPRSDYANWLSARKTAAHKILVEVWVELDIPSANVMPDDDRPSGTASDNRAHEQSTTKWRKLKHVGGIVDLRRLRELEEAVSTLLFVTLAEVDVGRSMLLDFPRTR